MHYCIHLLTKQLPTEKEIEKIMEPYSWYSIDDEDTDDEKKKIEYPVFTWDWYQIGGRYSACLKLKVDGEDSENREHYNWGYLENNPRNERLFHSALLSELKEMQKYHLRIQKNHISQIWDTVMDTFLLTEQDRKTS